ncbi:PREDICTED: probable G-protein coupled receptor Mth-like 3 [Papilio xuthus]|uniref:Probable G-protein coupled receptor Mth-like 3 n=1 Tax=Papilio xuthus TaxID=66420 RepID=A0AAJ6ZEC3_PAPXU|nr:PREDICTED: probable G-protein coupled receptor Mth-like 3 [Papilio xuthus]
MYYLTGSVIILVLFSSTNCVELEDTLCCSPGLYLYQDETNAFACWDPKTNNDSDITYEIICEHDIQFETESDTISFSVREDGYLLVNVPNDQIEIAPNTFCVSNYTKSTNESFLADAVVSVLGCRPVPPEPLVSYEVSAYCMLVSVVFLFLTALVYIALPEIRDLNGKSFINFCVSLALGLLCIAINNLLTFFQDMNLCATRGFLIYFFLIASFFWSNAISIQILRSMRRPLKVDYGWKEFAWYALYAWGSSTVLTVGMAIVNFMPGNHQKPGIGLRYCGFYNKKQQWYYMYSVMSILISANICIFVYTSVLLWRQSFASTHLKALKYKFLMTIRLFIIMGIPWVFEMISSLTERSIIWVILDFVNVLQGPLIFLVLVVLRRRVVKALLRRGVLDCLAPHVERHLALADDDEDVIQHTMDVPMDEKVTI